MGSKSIKRTTMPSRRKPNSRRQLSRRHSNKTASTNGGGASACSSVSDKLEALKSLLPAHTGGDIKADELFEETADYILMLRTQVSILQTMVDFYDHHQTDNVIVQ
ncbi:hypothetical protein LguiB_009005 [Lonicera macranthoides]